MKPSSSTGGGIREPHAKAKDRELSNAARTILKRGRKKKKKAKAKAQARALRWYYIHDDLRAEFSKSASTKIRRAFRDGEKTLLLRTKVTTPGSTVQR